MASLRTRMARHGFESNDDYELQMRCFLEQPVSHLRCLNIEGDLPRRKTAFAQALAHARVARLCFGATDPKSGGVLHGARVFAHPQAHHAPEVLEGFEAGACAALLRGFFAQRR